MRIVLTNAALCITLLHLLATPNRQLKKMAQKPSKPKKPNRIVEPARATISMLTEEKNHFEKLANAESRSLSNFFRINVVENLKRKGRWPESLEKLRQP